MYKRLCNGKSECVTKEKVLKAFEDYYSSFSNKKVRDTLIKRAMTDIEKGVVRPANGVFYRKVKE
jgi:hypothetical protein